MPLTARRETLEPALDTPAVLAGNWVVCAPTSHAGFVAGALAGLKKARGRFRSLSGSLNVSPDHVAGALVIDSWSIDTGNRLRDRHLRSRGFFDAGRHPQIRYHAHSISSSDSGGARIDGQLMVADTCTPLSLDVALHRRGDGVVELACQVEVDRVALGVRGARAMVPRAVQLDLAIVLRRVTA